ncbi:hypothetical protein GCM10027404_32760 [Arthrobacter tumbae]
MGENVSDFRSYAISELFDGSPFASRLPTFHQIRLGQLTKFFLQLQREPIRSSFYTVSRSVRHRHLIKKVA